MYSVIVYQLIDATLIGNFFDLNEILTVREQMVPLGSNGLTGTRKISFVLQLVLSDKKLDLTILIFNVAYS